jgi:hypothetical protein
MQAGHYRPLSHAHFFTFQTSFLIPSDYVHKCCIQRISHINRHPSTVLIRTGNIVERNIEARLYNRCCSGIAISIIYYVCVAVGIHHAMRLRSIVICGLSSCAVFFLISSTARFSKEKKLLNVNREFRIFYDFFLKYMSDIW